MILSGKEIEQVTAEYIRIYQNFYDSEEEGDCHG